MAGDAGELTRPHPAVGALAPLLARLKREDQVAVGAARAARAEELLARLRHAGIELADADAAADWLAPVLCASARDQRALRARLRADARARAATQHDAAPTIEASAAPIRAEAIARADRQRGQVARRTAIVALAIGLPLLGMLLVLVTDRIAPLPILPPPPPPWTGPAALLLPAAQIVLPALAALLASVLLARLGAARMRMALAPPRAPREPTGEVLPILAEGRLRAALRGLSRRVDPGGRLLDLPRSIAATVRQAGLPSLVFGGRPKLPRYVLLADLAGAADAMRLPAEALRRRLADADVETAAFRFHRTPAVLRPWARGGRGLRLQRIAARHRGARLLVVSDGAGLARGTPGFTEFTERTLLTPLPRAQWGWRETALHADGWQVVPMSSAGVAQVAAWLSGPREAAPPPPPRVPVPPAPDLAELIARDPTLTDPFRAPEPGRRDRLMGRLRAALGEPGFALLCALAAGPAPLPATAERIAAHLSAQGLDLPDEAQGSLLLRLPWLRRGALPTWLREDLMAAMPEAWRQPVRTAWLLHLSGQALDAPASHASRAALPPEAAAQLARLVGEQLGANADPLLRQLIDAGQVAPPRRWWQIDAGSWTGALAAAALTASVVLLLDRFGAALLAWARADAAVASGQPTADVLRVGAAVLALGFLVLPSVPMSLRALGVLAGLGLGVLALATDALRDVALLQAVWMSVVLVLVRERETPVIAPRALLGAGQPWLNALALAAMAGMLVITAIPGVPNAADWLLQEAGVLACAVLFALAAAARAVDAGALSAAVAGRAAARFVAGQALAAGLVAASWEAAGQAGLVDLGRSAALFSWTVMDARMLFGLIAAAAPFVGPGMWWRPGALFPFGDVAEPNRPLLICVMVALAALLPPMVIAALGPQLPIWLVTVLGLVTILPARLGLVLALAAPGRWRWLLGLGFLARLPLLIVIAAEWQGLQELMLGQLSTTLGETALPLIFALPEYLLLWLAVRRAHHDLVVTPSDGLWWRCLLLPLCTLGLGALDVRAGPVTALIVPLAAWIAARHGMRAVPAMALAMAPLALRYRGIFGGAITVQAGGAFGAMLAALLVARFVADAAFRTDCLNAARLARWQVAALAVLPLGYASPQFLGFDLVLGTSTLLLALMALLGLSQVPLRTPLLVLAASGVVGFAVNVAVGWPAAPTLGRITHGFSNIPGDLVSIMLALGLFRMLRDGTLLEPAQPLLVRVRDRPTTFAAVLAPLAYLVSLTLTVRGGFQGAMLQLMPFQGAQFLLLTLFCAAAGFSDRPWMTLAARAVPWPVALAAAVMLASLLIPGVTLPVGPFTLNIGTPFGSGILLGRNPLGAVGLVATVYAFHRLGLGLRRLMPIAALRQVEPAR